MTAAELLALSPCEKSQKLARFSGLLVEYFCVANPRHRDCWTHVKTDFDAGVYRPVPLLNYTTDLNAITAAAAKLTPAQQVHYINALLVTVTGKPLHGIDVFGYSQAFALAQASAEQRADAALLALEVVE